MIPYETMDKKLLQQTLEAEKKVYDGWKAQCLKLNMARGRPSKEQLDLVSDILSVLVDPQECIVDGVDARNYGVLAGLQCAREYWADVLGCKWQETFVGGASSLTLMYDVIAKAYTNGLRGSERTW